MGIQAINGNSFLFCLENTETFEMMKFMVKIVIKNTNNTELKWKLTQIIYNEELFLDNILRTVNKPENYEKLLNTLEDLSKINETIKQLYQHVKTNKYNIKTKNKTGLENLQKTMLLSYFYDEELQKSLINDKPIAVILIIIKFIMQ